MTDVAPPAARTEVSPGHQCWRAPTGIIVALLFTALALGRVGGDAAVRN
jgi:hypothetical protein